MRKLGFAISIFLLIAPISFSQATVQEEAYKLYIKAINEKNIDVKIELLEQYLAQYGRIGLDYDKYVYANLTFVYNQKGNHEKTVEYGEKAISAQELDILTKINLYLVVSGAYNELNRNLEKAYNYAKMAQDLATAQMEMGSAMATKAQWMKLIAGADFLEGALLIKRGEFKDGIAKWATAYKILKSPHILRQFKLNGENQYKQKKYENAELFFRAHFELSNDPELAYWLGKTCFFMNKFEETEKYLLIAYDKRKSSEIALNLGIIANKKNKTDEALRYFAEAVALNNHSRFSADAKKYLESLYQKKYGNIEGIEKVIADAKKRLGLS
ncbi:MAG: tetratricopeptide repeat protein [Candidatus Aminicenantia bacterium]